ncbi:MAG: hypothetical protein V4534_00690 [Myxococcota bacterium]
MLPIRKDAPRQPVVEEAARKAAPSDASADNFESSKQGPVALMDKKRLWQLQKPIVKFPWSLTTMAAQDPELHRVQNGTTRFMQMIMSQDPERATMANAIAQHASVEDLSKEARMSDEAEIPGGNAVSYAAASEKLRLAKQQLDEASAAREKSSPGDEQHLSLRVEQAEADYNRARVILGGIPEEERGQTPLGAALASGNKEVASTIIRKLPTHLINVRDLSIAFRYGHVEEAKEMMAKMKSLDFDKPFKMPPLSVEMATAIFESGHRLSSAAADSIITQTKFLNPRDERLAELSGITYPKYLMAQAESGNQPEENIGDAIDAISKGLDTVGLKVQLVRGPRNMERYPERLKTRQQEANLHIAAVTGLVARLRKVGHPKLAELEQKLVNMHAQVNREEAESR